MLPHPSIHRSTEKNLYDNVKPQSGSRTWFHHAASPIERFDPLAGECDEGEGVLSASRRVSETVRGVMRRRALRDSRVCGVSSVSKDVPALTLGPPQLHHICVAVHGVLWRPTAVGDLRKLLKFGPWHPMGVNCRIPDGSENHGAPGSNPGPATVKRGVLQVKHPRTRTEALRLTTNTPQPASREARESG
jgi:hypothetical protein